MFGCVGGFGKLNLKAFLVIVILSLSKDVHSPQLFTNKNGRIYAKKLQMLH
jgi:hypothetical protein